MSIIAKQLLRLEHKCLIYADDMVIFLLNIYIERVIEYLNSGLINGRTILTNLSLAIVLKKCKSVIFTQQKYADYLKLYLDDYSIPFAPNVPYLCINLDPKLRWLLHITSLPAFTCR